LMEIWRNSDRNSLCSFYWDTCIHVCLSCISIRYMHRIRRYAPVHIFKRYIQQINFISNWSLLNVLPISQICQSCREFRTHSLAV